MADELISRQALRYELTVEMVKCARMSEETKWTMAERVLNRLDEAPAVDAVEVVRCAQCKHGIWDEEEGLWMCVFTADYDEELGVYHGFIQHNTADYYCADGKRWEENGDN